MNQSIQQIQPARNALLKQHDIAVALRFTIRLYQQEIIEDTFPMYR